VRTVRHGDEELRLFGGRPMVARLEYRLEMITRALEQEDFSADRLAGVAGAEGCCRPYSAVPTLWTMQWSRSFIWRDAESMRPTWARCLR